MTGSSDDDGERSRHPLPAAKHMHARPGRPAYDLTEFREKLHATCLCIFVINEGEKVLKQLKCIRDAGMPIDVVLADGGSVDGSTEPDGLFDLGVNTLLVKRSEGKLGTQMRMAFDWAIDRSYRSIIVMDGNGKDGVEGIGRILAALNEGVDHVQGSRFIPGGESVNLPLSRWAGLKFLHAPLMRWTTGFPYTDTTNGFRGYSSEFLTDPRVDAFRDVFAGYELHYYLARQAARLGFDVKEVPVRRSYPAKGPTPTKISPVRGNLGVIERLFAVCMGKYDPPKSRS